MQIAMEVVDIDHIIEEESSKKKKQFEKHKEH